MKRYPSVSSRSPSATGFPARGVESRNGCIARLRVVVLAAGRADLCLLARAHLWDPYWTRHAAYEQGWPLKWPNQYETLNQYKPRFS